MISKRLNSIVFILLPGFFMAVLPSFGQSNKALDPFDGISITGNIHVKLIPGESESATLYAEGIPEENVKVKVENGILKLRLLNSIFYKDDKVKIEVVYKTLRSIRGQAGAIVESNATLTGDNLEIVANSGSQIELDINTNFFEGSSSEGSHLEISGRTNSQRISAVTGGHYEGMDLTCANTYVKTGTGGQAKLNAEELLEASATTGGSIEYAGNPKEKYIKDFLGGDIRKY